MTTTTEPPVKIRRPQFAPDVEAALDLLHPIFRECLDPDSSKFDLGSPWIIGDKVYATDGRILVWEPPHDRTRKVVEAIKPNGKPKLTWAKLEPLIPPMDHFESEWRDPPSLDGEPLCTSCKGQKVREPFRCDCCDSYVVGAKCDECGGVGRGERDPQGRWRGKSIAPGCDLSFQLVDLLTRHWAKIKAPLDPRKTSQVRLSIGSKVEGVLMPLEQDR